MNPVQKRLSCKNHKPTYENQNSGGIVYFCLQCGWRGQFGVSIERKQER